MHSYKLFIIISCLRDTTVNFYFTVSVYVVQQSLNCLFPIRLHLRGNQAVADPGFPRRDVANPKDGAPTYYLANFFYRKPLDICSTFY